METINGDMLLIIFTPVALMILLLIVADLAERFGRWRQRRLQREMDAHMARMVALYSWVREQARGIDQIGREPLRIEQEREAAPQKRSMVLPPDEE